MQCRWGQIIVTINKIVRRNMQVLSHLFSGPYLELWSPQSSKSFQITLLSHNYMKINLSPTSGAAVEFSYRLISLVELGIERKVHGYVLHGQDPMW
jgi:hypothetical protein